MVALAGPDLILIRPGMDPEVVVVAMETAVAMEMVVAMATEEEAEKVLLEELVGLEELGGWWASASMMPMVCFVYFKFISALMIFAMC